jgi:tetratricopeptide (TPR) repeat protein
MSDSFDQVYERALALIGLRRYSEAEKLLGARLARSPHDAHAHALLAHALIRQDGRYEDALREARAAVHHDPSLAEGHYILGVVQSGRDPGAALAAFEGALRLDPRDARFYAALAGLHLAGGRLPQALEAALEGRKADPRSVSCANLQAVALMRMGRNKEAAAVAQEALGLDPENAQAHADRGWSLLYDAQFDLARVSFGQALRIDPRLEHAREGLVEALKARWPAYALALRALLWTEQHRSGRWAWGLLAAIFIPPLVGLALIGQRPALGAMLLYFSILPFAIGILARLARPVFDLLLRLDPYARLTLSRAQVIRTNWVIAGPAIVILATLVMAVSGSPELGILTLVVLLVIARLALGAANPDERRDPMRPV